MKGNARGQSPIWSRGLEASVRAEDTQKDRYGPEGVRQRSQNPA